MEVLNGAGGSGKLPEIIHQPTYKETPLVRFTKFVEDTYNISFEDYWKFRQWTADNYPEFWECVWKYFDIKSSTPYTKICEKKCPINKSEWFVGAQLNVAENVLRNRDSKTALISTNKDNVVEKVTYAEMYEEVRVYVQALRDAGVKKGDTVACYMTHKKEAVYAHLAAMSIGAVWLASTPLIGPQTIVSTFKSMKPKVLFTCGNFQSKITEIRMDHRVKEISEGIPSIEKIIYVPSSLGQQVNELMSIIPNSIDISEFLAPARKKLQPGGNIIFEQLPMDFPVAIHFSSGTTGHPKGMVHDSGILLTALRDNALSRAITEDDVILSISGSGWVIWGVVVCALALRPTLLLYEGDPFLESPTRVWDLVDKFGITSSYYRGAHLEEMERRGYVPNSQHSLKSLRQLLPIGNVIKFHSFDFMTEKIKPNLFCSPTYGMTEMYGSLVNLNHNLPVYKGQIRGLALGMDLRILKEDGNFVIGEQGELVLTTPFPSLPKYLVCDPEDKKLCEAYLQERTGYWKTNDTALIDPNTNGLVLYGRKDLGIPTTAGKVWASEVQNVLVGFEGISDTMCLPHFTDLKLRIIVFVLMEKDKHLNEELKSRISSRVLNQISSYAVPDAIIEAPEFPFNFNGKKMENLVKDVINKKSCKNLDTITNAPCMEFFKSVSLE